MASEAPERRLAAILSADVAGYSRLMAEDEDATVRTLRAWREQVAVLVAELRGRLADFTGDNFLASFGAALDAVACALEIQRVFEARNAALPEARRMRFRIGAHLGDVRVEGDRLFGDGVNVAARLQPLAEPPFTNMSGDPEQEYFADGISEDITTALARTSTLFVISRNSAFTYKGKTFKIEDVGRELGVRYVLEGSVRRAGERVRVTAQLIDAESGHHVWSERYDRGLEDIFAVQSEITEEILAAVGATISDAELERIRRKPTESLTAYDASARGIYHFQRARVADMAEARRWFERAIDIDPDFAAALVFLGSTYTAPYGLLFDLDPASLDQGEALQQRAVELDPGLATAQLALGIVQLWRGQPERARPLLERARELAPNDPTPHFFLALLALQAGDPLGALASFRTGVRLNPRLESSAQASMLLAQIYSQAGRPDEAEALWQRARADNPDMILVRLWLTAHLEGTGRHPEAREVLAEALEVNPELSAEAVARHGLFARLPDLETFLARLRAAGLP